MKNNNGFTMPATIALSFFLLAFLVHYANVFLLEKKFYHEAEEKLALDIIMYNGIQDMKQNSNSSDTFLVTYYYDQGQATINASGSTLSSVIITCKTMQNRTYKASFQYNKDTKQIMNWSEVR